MKTALLTLLILLASCDSSKKKVVCQHTETRCSHREGCAVYYICEDRSINNMAWFKVVNDCIADKHLSSFCKNHGFPCVERHCGPPPVPCQSDADCPELGLCDENQGKCVESCVCFAEIEWYQCRGSYDCSDENAMCDVGYFCEPESKTCRASYCSNQQINEDGYYNPLYLTCSSGYYCDMEQPIVNHFCNLLTSWPIGRCRPSPPCETAADCTDPKLPVCDHSLGVCVPPQ